MTQVVEEKAIVPELRLAKFKTSQSYSSRLFEDVFLFSSGKNIKQDEAAPEYLTPCVRYGELYHLYGEVIRQIINNTNLDEADLTFSEGDEILLPSAGEDPLDIGSASALTLKNVAIGRTINVLKPKGEIAYSHVYASYYINQKLRKKISTLARGASISNVYNSDLKKLIINLPKIEEQQEVAVFLMTVDEKISRLNRKRELLETYKRGVMQKIFSQELRFKKKGGGDFPDWEEKRAHEIFSNHSNKNHNGDLPILAATQDGGMVYRDGIGKEIKTSEASVNSYKLVEVGDFVISLRSFQGGIEYSRVHGICSPAYTILKPSVEIDDDFYRHYFKRESFISQLSATVIGIRDGKQISYDAFSGMKLWYPSLSEQKKISEFIGAIDEKILVQNKQLEQLETFKKYLLQKMFI